MAGREGEVLRKLIGYTALLLVLTGLLALAAVWIF
jgi:L-lactate permease